MSFIQPVTISFPPTGNSSGPHKDVPSPPVFFRGEVLAAEVSEKIGGGRVLLTLKNVSVVADAGMPLNAGEKLTVRVEQVQPRIVLSVIAKVSPETAIISDYLKMQRANPDSLINLIRGAEELLPAKNLGELSRYIMGQDINKILSLVGKMIFSQGNLKDPLFLKNFVSMLGLLWESDLKKVMNEPSKETSILNNRDNLKSLLMKLSADLHSLKGSPTHMDSETNGTLNKLAEFTDRSIKSIEMQQVINVLAQENEHKYVFQIPFLSSEGIRKGDIFIEFEGEESGNKSSGAQYAVVIFLTMDGLGDMMIKASVSEKTIGCVITCDNNAVRDFVSASAEDLKNKFLSLGYKIDRLSCLTEENLPRIKYEYWKDQDAYGREVVDYFA
jgi:hypothetical protein